MNHYVYEITNLVNGKKYIGKRSCKCDINNDPYMGSGVLIKKAITKYGKENFEKIIIKVCDSEEDAYSYEKCYINAKQAYKDPQYYNIGSGGLGNQKGVPRTKQSILKVLETKRKNGTLPVGDKNPMYGRFGKENPRSIPVIMISFDGDLDRFASLNEAGAVFQLRGNVSRISSACKRGGGEAYGHIFLYENDYIEYKNSGTLDSIISEIKNKHEKRINSLELSNMAILMIDRESGAIEHRFCNCEQAAQYLGVHKSAIVRNIKHGCNTVKGCSFVLECEYEEVEKSELCRKYSRKIHGTKRPTTYKAVYCTTTDQKFDSVKDAVDYFGMCRGAKIAEACTGKRMSCGKHPITNEPLKWQYFDEHVNGLSSN